MLVNVDLTQEAHQDFRNELFKNWFLFQSIPSENFPNILFDRIVSLVIVRKAVAANLHNSVFLLLLLWLLFFLSFTGKPRRHLFDILADEAYKRRFKLRQREIIEESDSEITA